MKNFFLLRSKIVYFKIVFFILGQDWARIVPLVAAGVVIGLFAGFKVASLKPVVNLNRKQQPDSDKVVHQVFVEDLGDKKAFCRCWRSNNVNF